MFEEACIRNVTVVARLFLGLNDRYTGHPLTFSGCIAYNDERWYAMLCYEVWVQTKHE